MSILSIIFTTLVAIEFIYIMFIQTIQTHSKNTSRIFKIPEGVLNNKFTATLMKNQGIYNGIIGILLLYGTFIAPHPKEIVIPVLIYAIVVAIYGALTSQKSIIIKQGLLPIITLIILII
ncbi:DUF1304 family protein [Apilactobacillus micheneri]|uniref:DUF1304 family protein n=1 Tax=Apilactobacillus micheneri TaxID=1899430 RepID=A0ABY2Z0W4_9LACO|nr:DUF1304 family protein [Apilactobacillus micheneri]TPR26459.1 DUF1304 family protein [Apilactobacillus micheneri]TPR27213.1 DUF1304 family protein [Apilactobacillus micheneri]TPR27460.1 DUF1304 family protein [Apilactobacillus micheneri]TPR31976.1 DUF1304 family protein [Apilactobacillus micheneri]TPR32380.1 DUF1304 family protein [Apilactobacillus micheneri]